MRHVDALMRASVRGDDREVTGRLRKDDGKMAGRSRGDSGRLGEIPAEEENGRLEQGPAEGERALPSEVTPSEPTSAVRFLN